MTLMFLIFLESGYSLCCILVRGKGDKFAVKCKILIFFSTGFLDMAKLMQASNILPFHPLPSPFLSPPLLTLGFFLGSV